MRLYAVLVLLVTGAAALRAQDTTLEYRVKAAYLNNFLKFVEWPAVPGDGPVTICVAGRNPFGGALAATIDGEQVAGRPVTARTITTPGPGCHLLFVPEGAPAADYLRAAQGSPTLTVGESPDFIRRGGMINFVREGPNIRFEIDAAAAERAGLRISSRLLRLARMPQTS
jgi:hypothetical protein